jgi:hypothetical protein
MAGFGDSNDIKITVALDTKDAVDGVKRLTDEINLFLKRVEAPFKKLGDLSKEVSKVQIADIKAKRDVELKTLNDLDKANQRKHERILERIRNEVAYEKIASNEFIRLEKIRVDESNKLNAQRQQTTRKVIDDTTKFAIAQTAAQLEAEKSANVKKAKDFAETEKTKRTELLKTIALINQDTAKIRKAPRAPADDTAGSGKLIEGLKNSIAALSFQFGNVNVGFGTFINNFKNLGAAGGAVAAVVAAIGAIQKLDNAINELAAQANKVEGLSTGFATLQRTIGQDPTKSIERLREATRGLVSDVDLYQRANQAVLLGVPTDVFNEAAAAAVKLGRAMGIDAAFGLESLSLGLGRQSRLYLDNLGIIVSAEEAYKNFALTVGKSANDLTDAEKKAAFFAEALKKIKERAEELPEPLDTVGIALQKLQAAQDNANKKFNEGFNASQPLIQAYKDQAQIAQATIQINEKLGLAVGALAAPVKNSANAINLEFLKAKIAFIEFVDIFADLRTAEEKLKGFETRLQSTEERIRKLTETRDKLQAQGFTLGNPRFADVDAALQRTQDEAKALREEIVKLRGEGDKGIKINVDNSEVIAARSQISTLFSDLRVEAERQAGIFKVPGIADPQAAKIFSELKTAKQEFDKSAQDTTAVEKYTAALNKLEQDVSTAAAKSSFGNLAKNVTIFADAATSGKIGQAKQAFGGIKGALTQLSKGAGIASVDLKALAAGLTGVTKESKKTTKPLSDTAKALKQQQQQLKELTKSLGRALDRAIPPGVQQQLVDVFNAPQKNAEELQAKIQAIGEAFLKAGGDYQAFAKEVGELNKLKNEAPDNLIEGSSQNEKKLREASENLKKLKAQSLDIRKILFGGGTDASGNETGGAFFGFDLGSSLTAETESQLAGQVQDFLATAAQAGVDGFAREDIPQIASGLGALIGGGLAAYFSAGDPTITAAGAQAGAFIGSAFAPIIEAFGKDLPGTRERKSIDQYFATLFDGDRLAVVIQGQLTGAIDEATGAAIRSAQPQLARISDLVFEGMTPFAGDVEFGGEDFSNYFNTLSAEVQNSFNGIGIALGSLLGVSEETVRLIGTAIANNIGGELQNLQVLIQQTGESFEDLSKAILKAFRDSQITAEEAYNALVQLQNIYAEGIPGAIGDFQQAIENLNTSLENNQPGQYALDSLRDIGAEGEEARASFETVVSSLGQTFGFAADQQARLFEALRLSGITSLQQLSKATDEQLITLIRNINAIRQNAEAPLAAAPVITSTTPSGSGRRREKSAAEIAADLLKKQREEARKLVQDSQEYLSIIEKINSGQLTSVQAGKEIVKLNAEVLSIIKQRDKAEKDLNAELDKGAKGNAKTIADLSASLLKLEERLKKVKEKAAENKREYKDLDISAVMPLIRSQNTLGLVARQIGVSLEKNVDILVKGFLQGRLSIKQVNDEINKTKELLGPGIPNSVGAVTDAFQNLIDAGTKGGQFSVDAFTDIFAEFREKFNKEGSAFRETQRKQLNENLDAARRAALVAVGPEATEAARKGLELAKKAIEDFKNTPVAPDLSDLRDQLRNSFNPADVEKFFQALDESGLKSFEELEGASSQAIVGILGRLQELGFNFNKTSEEAKGVNKELRDAEEAANGGLDPLKEAIQLVRDFNNSAGLLPPVFNSTTDAVGKMEGPLGKIKDKISDTVELLGKLGGQTFENDIVFNIRTTGEQGGKALVELIFGDGSEASTDTGNGKKTPPKKETSPKETPSSNDMGKRSDWIRQGPGIYKNRKTGKTVRSRTNPGA